MRLARLMLQAFGPFSGETLDFAHSAANLHLVYGPNEAGKSSALRAMLDLRFGVPQRSTDTFLHAARELRIAGVFIDPEGVEVGLVRRKGRKDTLHRFDPAAGPAEPQGTPTAELVHALTAGLQRAEFEMMFGIDHARLREGGRNLVRGEGELGAALFEASAGTQGVAALVETLDADAKRYFNPHGRSQNATINAARHDIEQARRALREAQTRPNDWHRLQREHEEAVGSLQAIGAALETARRRENELTALSVVEPQLRRCDQLARELEALAGVPDLPADARERRLAAEQAQQRAAIDRDEARAELARCDAALGSLASDPRVLEHAEAVERLAAAAAPARRARTALRQHQLELATAEQELALRAARIAPGLALSAVLGELPSRSDRVSINQHLQAVDTLRVRRDGLREQAAALREQLAGAVDAPVAATDPAALEVLEQALEAARGLGDVAARLRALGQEIDAAQGRVTQGLADLGVASIAALRAARPLLEADVGAARGRFEASRAALRQLHDERDELHAHIAQQRMREKELTAAGAVASTQSLAQARERRDRGWALVRAAYVERREDPARIGPGFDATRPLADAFELAQREADHHADLLRVDTDRVARLGESRARIEQMTTALAANGAALDERRAEEAAQQQAWRARLAAAGLPDLSPESLAEWQTRRVHLLELQTQLERQLAVREDTVQQAEQAVQQLRAAFEHSGIAPPAASGPAVLAGLATHAARALREATERAAAVRERERAGARARTELERIDRTLAELGAARAGHEGILAGWLARLHLAETLDIETFRARLDELDELAHADGKLRDARRAVAADAALADEFTGNAHALARLLDMPAPDDADDFCDRVQQRLVAAREAELKRRELLRDRARALQDERRAGEEWARQCDIVAGLCSAGDVSAPEALAAVEEAAARKQRLGEALQQVRRDIAEASTHSEPELRERLRGLDSAAIERELADCRAAIAVHADEQQAARVAEEAARHALAAIDDSDRAAAAREAIEGAAARLRAALRPWARLRLGHALLASALVSYRERAQGPMLASASEYFALITDGRYTRLTTDEADGTPVLRALRAGGEEISLDAMSEGTADQLYLALRLAALELRRAVHPDIPLVLDDVLVTSDDERATRVFHALARYAAGGQVLLFTHHRHLIDVARAALGEDALAIHTL